MVLFQNFLWLHETADTNDATPLSSKRRGTAHSLPLEGIICGCWNDYLMEKLNFYFFIKTVSDILNALHGASQTF